jgi:hypothetical protein
MASVDSDELQEVSFSQNQADWLKEEKPLGAFLVFHLE